MTDQEKYTELNEKELAEITGGTGENPPKYPIGTKVLENAFNQEIGQDKGEVIAYGWPQEDGSYMYIIRWEKHGEKKHTESEVRTFYMTWDLSR